MRKLFSLLSSTELGLTILTASSYLLSGARAVNFAPIPPSNLDLSQLGRVAIAGEFDAISLYQFEGQNQNGLSTNGSHALLSRFPSGAFATLQASDAYIKAMCSFTEKDGSFGGVVVGGNFTSLGGVETQGIAIFQPNTSAIQPMPGLNGSVNALYCDNSSNTIYVGGSFTGGNSSNAIAWTTGWTNLPFAGFNGPVNSITKSSNGNIIFGGSFTGLGNTTTPTIGDGQVIPITSASLSAGPSTTQPGFSDPSNIVCATGQGGSGNTWLLADNSPGEWTANFGFGFVPSRLRLWNTNQDGRGTQTFRFTALPINGIMNFTYIDGQGVMQSCTSQCPLNQSTVAQDFTFVNPVGMNGFRVDISAWYGAGGGLAGIELLEDDIYTFAVDDFNEPSCDAVANPSSATSNGPWNETNVPTTPPYLSAQLSGANIDPNSATVVFKPDIQQSGNYSVTIFTPGCLSDNTCNTRGRVNISGQFSSGTTSASQPVSTQIFQTNNFDKYDQIYFGYVDATSSSFRPSVTLQPAAGQNGPLTVVAQRVRFELLAGSGGLNGLFQYNPNQANVSTDYTNDAIDAAGNSLSAGAVVHAVTEVGSTLYVAGNFSSSAISNVFSVGSNATSLAEGGLNNVVNAMYQNSAVLYLGGAFSATIANKTQGLTGVASYNTSSNAWVPLGAGVNGVVDFIVPFNLNLTGTGQPVLALGVSGQFSQVNAFGSFNAFPANSFAAWIPSKSNWLQNLNIPTIFVSGVLVAGTDVPGFSQLYSGTVISQVSSASGGVELAGSNALSLQQFAAAQEHDSPPVTVISRKRQANNVPTQSVTGVVTGAFIEQNNLNITAFGGHFSATATNGSTINTLMLINGSNADHITGLTAGVDPGSVFVTLGASGTLLFAGGNVTGNVNGNNVNGMIVYDMVAAGYASTQPPSLNGTNVAVNAIAPQPSGTAVYVGGSFDSAGNFGCPSLCVFDTGRSQWNSPGNGLSGIVTALSWIGSTSLLVGGSLTVSGNASSVATYNPKSQTFSTISNTGGPSGTVTALTPGSSDGSQIWVAGENTDGSAFFSKWDGSKWNTVNGLLGTGSVVRGLQMFTLTKNHGNSALISANSALVLFGQLNLPNFGNASAAIYNGTTLEPFMLSNSAAGEGGSLSAAFVQNPQNFFRSNSHKLAVGFIVLIALAISLGLIFLLVVLGILAERYRRRREGYMPAPTGMTVDRNNNNISRIPPEYLLGSVGPGGGRGGTL